MPPPKHTRNCEGTSKEDSKKILPIQPISDSTISTSVNSNSTLSTIVSVECSTSQNTEASRSTIGLICEPGSPRDTASSQADDLHNESNVDTIDDVPVQEIIHDFVETMFFNPDARHQLLRKLGIEDSSIQEEELIIPPAPPPSRVESLKSILEEELDHQPHTSSHHQKKSGSRKMNSTAQHHTSKSSSKQNSSKSSTSEATHRCNQKVDSIQSSSLENPVKNLRAWENLEGSNHDQSSVSPADVKSSQGQTNFIDTREVQEREKTSLGFEDTSRTQIQLPTINEVELEENNLDPPAERKCVFEESVPDSISILSYPGIIIHSQKQPNEILSNLLDTIGATDMIHLRKLSKLHNCKCQILAKLEYKNPTGSTEARVAYAMIESAIAEKKLQLGGSVICTGSANLCLSTAWICGLKGYGCKLIPPPNTSENKISIMEAVRAHVIRVPKKLPSCNESPESAKMIAKSIAKSVSGGWILDPLDSPAGIMTHFLTTAEEVISQSKPKINLVVCGGEGQGLIYGLSMKLRNSNVQKLGMSPVIIGVDLSENCFSDTDCREIINPPWEKEKYGSNFPQEFFDAKYVDKWVKATDIESYEMTRRLHREESVFVGPNGGAVLSCALKAIDEYGLKDDATATVVVILNEAIWTSDRGFMSEYWMLNKDYYLETKMEDLLWWWNMPISDVRVEIALTVKDTLTFANGVSLFDKCFCTRAVVVDAVNDDILGIITYGNNNIMTKSYL